VIPLGELPLGPLGVAVSGGGDSVALLMLLHHAGHRFEAATVDHGLRSGSAKEAADVSALCENLGIPHKVLVWDHGKIAGNIQNAAREARRGLLASWARDRGLNAVLLGHTLDDQAETVLMRMARGSGVDGLAAMAVTRQESGINWHRPLLAVKRLELRAYLNEIGVSWVDDPSNDDLQYDRIKARKALAQLAPLGLSAERLAETAAHMQRARVSLEADTKVLAQACVQISAAGELAILAAPFANATPEIQLRLLSSALGWVASAHYRPRFAALKELLAACTSSNKFGKTLHGCTIYRGKNEIVINREPAATPPIGPVLAVWDGRWEIDLKDTENLQIRALGEDGIQYCPDWRESAHSRRALLASPSFWQQGRLIAAPLAQFGQNHGVRLIGGEKGFMW